ncbi:T1Dc domain containing [Cryptosporidium sp. chipmunk genotype I]|uniref:T1Dc domain containing n=1 Tax=Cryptosporidium sp. chipmunk genotype I TaxID=1280935 RepID=UPI003519DDD1|nr:T1Dc domain containing [Cryptosporidium sp. chipmunk genotype I]
MGNIKSTEKNKLLEKNNSGDVRNSHSWCNLDHAELKKIGNIFGVNDLNIENIKQDYKIDLSSIKNRFPAILRRFYLGFFSFYCKDDFGKINLINFIECMNSILYCNKRGILNKILEYIISNISNDLDVLRIVLSIVYFEISFLLCDSKYSILFLESNESDQQYLTSLASYLDFEFIVKEYYKKKTTINYSSQPSIDLISEFIQEYLPLFTFFMRLSIRVHFDMISHPNNVQNTFIEDLGTNLDESKPPGSSQSNAQKDCQKKCSNGRCICSLNLFKLSRWVDDNSRILLTEHCCILRCQYFGEASGGECLTLFQPWNLLYASWKHGLSLHRLVSLIEGYSSHVLLLIRTTDNCIFGAVCTGDWKEGNGKYCGDETCFLTSFRPIFSIIGQSGKGRNFMYINTKYDFSPKGIGFGGEPEYSRLWLDSTLGTGTCLKSDLTYNTGMLYQPSNNSGKKNSCLLLGTPYSGESDESTTEINKFSVADIEVWGLGGENILKNYLEDKATNDYFKQERKVIDKSKFIKSEFDKEYLLGNTYSRGNTHSFN